MLRLRHYGWILLGGIIFFLLVTFLLPKPEDPSPPLPLPESIKRWHGVYQKWKYNTRDSEIIKNLDFMKNSNKKNTVMVMPVRFQDVEMALNSLCSLFNVKEEILNYLTIWALDQETYQYMESIQSKFKFEIIMEKKKGRREHLYANVARTGVNLLLMEPGIIWFDDPFERILHSNNTREEPDWIYMREDKWDERKNDLDRFPKMAGGLWWVKGTEEMARLWELVLKIELEREGKEQKDPRNYALPFLFELHGTMVGSQPRGWHVDMEHCQVFPNEIKVMVLDPLEYSSHFNYQIEEYCEDQERVKRVAVWPRGDNSKQNAWDQLYSFPSLDSFNGDLLFLDQDRKACSSRNPKKNLRCVHSMFERKE